MCNQHEMRHIQASKYVIDKSAMCFLFPEKSIVHKLSLITSAYLKFLFFAKCKVNLIVRIRAYFDLKLNT